MKIITRIRNILFLKKVLIENKDVNWNHLVLYGFGTYKNFSKNSFERNLMAAVLKKLRKDNPYQIKGWAKAEKAYKEYLNKENAIKSFSDLKEGGYLTRISNESPVKGDKLFEYYVNKSWNTREEIPYTIKLSYKSERHNYFNVEDDYYGEGVGEDDYTSYLYATKQEIKDYEEEKDRIAAVEKQIEQKQEEIDKLRDKI